MTDDFKNFVKNYDKSGKGAEKKKRRDSNRATLLWILFGGFILSCIIKVKPARNIINNSCGTYT